MSSRDPSLDPQNPTTDAPDDPHTDHTDAEAELNKWTFALTSDGDIRYDEMEQNVVTISKEPAVRQDLLVALGTYVDEDPIDPSFGLDVFDAVRTTQQLEDEITRTLMYDDYRHDRVESVISVDIVRSAHGSRENATARVLAKLRSGRELLLVFDLFSGTMSAIEV